MRVIAGVGYREHTLPIFKELGIRPLQTEIEYRKALLAYDIVNNPEEYGIRLPTEHNHNYPTRYAGQNLPAPTRRRTERYGTKGLEQSLLRSYNKLPNHIKQAKMTPLLAKRNIGKCFSIETA